MSIIDTIKERPVLAGGVALAAIVLVFVVMGSGGGDDAPAATGMSSIEAGNAMLMADQAANTQMAGIAASLDAAKINAATALSVREIELNSVNAANMLAADVEKQKIAASLSVETLQSSILERLETQKYLNERDITLANTNAALETERIRSATNIATQNILASAFATQAAHQANALVAASTINAHNDAANREIMQRYAELQARMRWG